MTIGTREGGTRDLVLRTFLDVAHAEDWLGRDAGALTVLSGTGVPAPGLVAVDPSGAHCEYPSLLMTDLPGRPVVDDEGLERRVPLLARQLVAIHAVRPAERPRKYVALTTPDTVVTSKGADAAAWAAATDEIAAASDRLYWQVRDALACSEEVRSVARPWRKAGRTALTTRAVEERLDAYVTALMDAPG